MIKSNLINIIDKWTVGKIRFDTPISGLSFHRSSKPTEPVSYLFSPHFCLIAQGAKHIILDTEDYIYDPNNYVLSSVDLPLVSKIIKASINEPYLGLTLELDLNEISKIMTDIQLPNSSHNKEHRGIEICSLSSDLSNAIERLVMLLETPNDIPILAPLIKKEIYYRLLTEGQTNRLHQILSIGTQTNKISKAIEWLKKNFNQSFYTHELAANVGMSESSFHQHFKTLTAMSPLQYQKKIRLNEAKRLMLVEKIDSAEASFAVGYDSPTQFNREYKRMFGLPPAKNIKTILEENWLFSTSSS